MLKIAVFLEKCEEGGFAASVPTLPGCFSEGETIEEALENIAEAIELHLEAVEDDLIVDDEILVKELVWDRSRPVPESRTERPRAESGPSVPRPAAPSSKMRRAASRDE